tara:strand:+ start:58 stop:864 length:807 start_codon:yes stop_codon:yes gene_type:complete
MMSNIEKTMNVKDEQVEQVEQLESIDESKEYDTDDSDASISTEDLNKLQEEVKVAFKKDDVKKKETETIVEPIVEPIIIKDIKKSKPKKLTKKQILEKNKLEELEKIKLEELPIKKSRGRPKKTLEEKLSKKTIIKEKIIYMIPNESGGYDPIKNVKPLSKAHLQKIENEKKVAEEEILIGKRIVRTKSGKGDQRSIKPRSEAQIAHSKKFVAMMAEKRKKKIEEINSNTKAIIKESIVEVVTQPLQSIPNYKPPVKSIQSQYNDFFS